MTATADRFRTAAEGLTERIEAVPLDRWDAPSPCEGWVARDVVGHVCEAISGFLGRFEVAVPQVPPVADDPLGAWVTVRDAAIAALEDPATLARTIDTPMGTMSLEDMVGRFGIGDLLVHTWDLARATGLDEQLDPDEVRRLYDTMAPNDELMRQGTAFGPKVSVADDADEQTRLIAFTGRDPNWQPA